VSYISPYGYFLARVGRGDGACYTARKFLYEARRHKESSCNSKAWQSDWALHITDNVLSQRFLVNASDDGNKNKQPRFRRSQGGYKMLFMMYIFT